MRQGAEIARGNALGRWKAKPKGLGSFARLDRREVKRPVLLLMDQKVMTRTQATDGRWIPPREIHAGRTGDEQDKHESRGLVITRTGIYQLAGTARQQVMLNQNETRQRTVSRLSWAGRRMNNLSDRHWKMRNKAWDSLQLIHCFGNSHFLTTESHLQQWVIVWEQGH
ncbi:hypothetical protein GOP47_0013879 [Adiantum capillus-veneris]|uniref:Uncharacterized protein n=1 Tax=Adiantum capillus-veneris TaxID=13818 RepID=A0A9D4UQL5_ADICA|nr:hypothetical protein GOP47_0013879 [Adiantum capillus-veneris]